MPPLRGWLDRFLSRLFRRKIPLLVATQSLKAVPFKARLNQVSLTLLCYRFLISADVAIHITGDG
jgi:hypothetical protein